jgi:hypothetical protein
MKPDKEFLHVVIDQSGLEATHQSVSKVEYEKEGQR